MGFKMQDILFSGYNMGNLFLKNRVVMAPMTRSRAIGNIPNELMAEYYRQRSGAGLIITEGTSPSPNGLGYSRIPGLYNNEHVEGWKKVTDAIHQSDGKVFLQIMHTGRVGHELNLPVGAKIVAPSAIKAEGKMWTDQKQLQDMPVPQEMTLEEIEDSINEYAYASQLAVEAGFDGVELHGANGYLIEQFLSPSANQRTDEFGGIMENRIRYVVRIAQKVAELIGSEKIGLRISPYGKLSTPGNNNDIDATYTLLAQEMDKIGIAYIHITDNGVPEAKQQSVNIKELIRNNFSGSIILSGGYTAEIAEKDLLDNKGDLIAFGRPFIANPNFVEKIKTGNDILVADSSLFFTTGEKGYTDYPVN